MEDINLILVAGGFARCDEAWNKEATAIDKVFKFYFPVSGRSRLHMEAGVFEVRSERVFFVDGHRLKRQVNEIPMDLYWVHFMPQSLYLSELLRSLPSVHEWPAAGFRYWKKIWKGLGELFERNETPDHRTLSPPVTMPSLRGFCQVEAMMLHFIGDMLAAAGKESLETFQPAYQRFKPAVTYMDAHYLENPPLEEIAKQVHLSPSYFQSRFARAFGFSPHRYMLDRRMNEACRLLSRSALSVKEIAYRLGYENEFYFSRVFKKRFQMSPVYFRKSAWTGATDISR